MNQSVGTTGRPVATWDLLRTLGFTEGDTVISDLRPSLSFDFGKFKLSASSCTSPRFVPVVLLTGAMVTADSFGEVQCELPPEVESVEQGMAWLAWCLDAAAGGRFAPRAAPAWLREGRLRLHLLPWNRESAAYDENVACDAYDARPRCAVRRDWARVALRTLGGLLTMVDDEAPVIFRFDGTVLTIRCAGKLTAMPAEGLAWTQPYSIRAGALRMLPKRLMSDSVHISIRNSVLTIGNQCYKPVVAINLEEGKASGS